MYTIRLDEQLVAVIERLAEQESRTRSNMIRRLIDEALAARGEEVKK